MSIFTFYPNFYEKPSLFIWFIDLLWDKLGEKRIFILDPVKYRIKGLLECG